MKFNYDCFGNCIAVSNKYNLQEAIRIARREFMIDNKTPMYMLVGCIKHGYYLNEDDIKCFGYYINYKFSSKPNCYTFYTNENIVKQYEGIYEEVRDEKMETIK